MDVSRSSFVGYPRASAPSDCETTPGILPSDSGYGSMSRASVGNPSIHGEVDQTRETQSMVENPGDFGFASELASELHRQGEAHGARYSWGEPANPQRKAVNKDLYCDVCKRQLKNRSEKK